MTLASDVGVDYLEGTPTSPMLCFKRLMKLMFGHVLSCVETTNDAKVT